MGRSIAEQLAERLRQGADYFPESAVALHLDSAPAYLRAMSEPSLLPGKDEPIAYRLLCMPSFRPASCFRVEERHGALTLVARMWSGQPLDGHGKLVAVPDRVLSEVESAAFLEGIEALDFWRQPFDVPHQGLDGTTFIFEGRRGSEHHVISRWSPDRGGPDHAFVHLCDLMTGFAPDLALPPPTPAELAENEERRRQFHADAAAAAHERAMSVARSNAIAARIKDDLARGVERRCPHCREVPREFRFKQANRDAEAFFVCGSCGRSSTGPELG
jgi:hypothetical protein